MSTRLIVTLGMLNVCGNDIVSSRVLPAPSKVKALEDLYHAGAELAGSVSEFEREHALEILANLNRWAKQLETPERPPTPHEQAVQATRDQKA
jgi:hypothetical protein